MRIVQGDNLQSIFDKHFAVKCPHCGAFSNITAISFPNFSLLKRFEPEFIGIVYRCDSCNNPVFLKFKIASYHENHVDIIEEYTEIEKPKETFDFQYLPTNVNNDFKEALTCYSNACYNAFAAMCRRCIQSIAIDIGAKGTDKVKRQVQNTKEIADIDDEVFDELKQIIIDGHDGVHPHLMELSAERAEILLLMMKDVLTQLYVRKARIQEAKELRNKQIEQCKE